MSEYMQAFIEFVNDMPDRHLLVSTLEAFHKARDIERQSATDIIPFGKYRGQKITDVCVENIGYLKWMANNTDIREKYSALIENIDKLLLST